MITEQKMTKDTTTALPLKPTGKHLIMVVDDLEPNRIILNDQILSLGHTPCQAVNGLDALDKIAQQPPDLILMDIVMPKMDGYTLLDQLKGDERFKHIPVIMISALDELSSVVRCIKQGAIDYMVKPFNPVLLKARINAALASKRLHDEHEAHRKQIEQYNQKLEMRVRERTKELYESRKEIIFRLGRAAEYRDNETGLHVFRMSHICARLAREIGLSEEECQMILLASPLHDIGKIGIPDSILLKPGKLDKDEWEIMKSHTTIGAEILSESKSDLLKMAELIALTHQEKWDGSGYPRGLRGKDIPLVGRIVTICDVFDALTSKRPYKRKWTNEEAKDYIEQEAGKHFDPELTKVFLNILPDVLEIQARFQENDDESYQAQSQRLSS